MKIVLSFIDVLTRKSFCERFDMCLIEVTSTLTLPSISRITNASKIKVKGELPAIF